MLWGWTVCVGVGATVDPWGIEQRESHSDVLSYRPKKQSNKTCQGGARSLNGAGRRALRKAETHASYLEEKKAVWSSET